MHVMFGMHASLHSCTALAGAFSAIYNNAIYAGSMSSRRAVIRIAMIFLRFASDICRLVTHRTKSVIKRQVLMNIRISVDVLSRTAVSSADDDPGNSVEADPLDGLQLSRYLRLIKEIGKPTQNTCMAKPTTVILKEDGALRAAERGITTHCIKKYTATA
jgi:hypothetical protein